MLLKYRIRASYFFPYPVSFRSKCESGKEREVRHSNTKDGITKKKGKYWFNGCIFNVPRRGRGTRKGREEARTPTRCACGAHGSSTTHPPSQQNRTKETKKNPSKAHATSTNTAGQTAATPNLHPWLQPTRLRPGRTPPQASEAPQHCPEKC